MPSLGCIADDFTGGTDLSGMLVKHGMRAVQIPGQAALNLMLTCCLWLPGNLHALFVVGDINANERTRMIVNAINPQQPQLVAPRQLAVAHKGRVGLIVLAAFFGLAVIGRFHRAEDTYPSTAAALSAAAPEDSSNANRLVLALTDAQIRKYRLESPQERDDRQGGASVE